MIFKAKKSVLLQLNKFLGYEKNLTRSKSDFFIVRDYKSGRLKTS